MNQERLLIRNGRVLDPSRNLDARLDLLIADGKIVEIGADLRAADVVIFDAANAIVAPGFVDMHVHLREPGKEEAETVLTGSRAAAAGGFTAVACMPNTAPVNDSILTTQFILQKAASAAVSVYPIAAITKNQAGEELTDFTALKESGVVAVSDDGRPVVNSRLMRQALEMGFRLNLTVIDHCEDPYLFQGGAMNEGQESRKLGIQGIPPAAEEIMVARNILLSKLTGGHVHLAHLSTAGSMELVRRAKAEKLNVTAEVTPHHFTLTDEAVSVYGTNAKMNPPLRSAEDLLAVQLAIADGTVDVIASDHAPHHAHTKTVEFHKAAFGIIGLETSVSLGLDRLVHTGLISLQRFVELYAVNSSRILGIPCGIEKGLPANITIFDPERPVTIEASLFQSKSRNTPFDGWSLKGSPVATIVNGRIVWHPPGQ